MSEQSNLIRFALLKKEAGQDFSFHALGRSMRPFIPSGSEVMIRPASSCKRGDIALVRTHSTLVLHRVVDIQSDSLVLRGDWNTQHQIVPLSHLIGVATRCIWPSGREISPQPSQTESALALPVRGCPFEKTALSAVVWSRLSLTLGRKVL